MLKQYPNHPVARLGIFPNLKEWSESAALVRAIRTHLPQFPMGDKSVVAVSVGDGQTPRTASLLSYKTKWQVHSVDPVMRRNEKVRLSRQTKSYPFLSRLHVHRAKIQDVDLGRPNSLIIVACHCHVTTDTMLNTLSGKRTALVCLPCCVEQDKAWGYSPDIEYQDNSIRSPKRAIKIWRNI